MEKNWSTFLAYVFRTVGGMLLIHGIIAFLELDVGPEVHDEVLETSGSSQCCVGRRTLL